MVCYICGRIHLIISGQIHIEYPPPDPFCRLNSLVTAHSLATKITGLVVLLDFHFFFFKACYIKSLNFIKLNLSKTVTDKFNLIKFSGPFHKNSYDRF